MCTITGSLDDEQNDLDKVARTVCLCIVASSKFLLVKAYVCCKLLRLGGGEHPPEESCLEGGERTDICYGRGNFIPNIRTRIGKTLIFVNI